VSEFGFLLHLPWTFIFGSANNNKIDPSLLAAIIMQESNGNVCAMRYEPGWRYVYNAEKFAKTIGSSVKTEEIGQSTSWGPCQVMGTVAREMGFRGWFSELCDPEVGIKYGARFFAQKVKTNETIDAAISAYNMGTARKKSNGKFENQHYVDGVREKQAEISHVLAGSDD